MTAVEAFTMTNTAENPPPHPAVPRADVGAT
jgi:hypothetical protein